MLVIGGGTVTQVEGVEEEEIGKDYSYDLRGYQQAFSTEVNGGVFGLKIFVKMRERKLVPFTKVGVIHDDIGSFAADIEKELRKNTALLDPQLPVRKAEHKKIIQRLFKDAGMEAIYMEEVPNEYSSDPYYYSAPWFIVTTQIGHIKIGARKRVIDIDWSKTVLKTSGKELFPDENVTNGGDYGDIAQHIHAWGIDKAREYLTKIYTTATAGVLGSSSPQAS